MLRYCLIFGLIFVGGLLLLMLLGLIGGA